MAGALDVANRKGGDLLIAAWLGSSALGLYSFSTRLVGTAVRFLTAPLIGAALPLFSRARTNPDLLEDLYLAKIQIVSLVSFPAFTIMALASEGIIPLLFGAQWVEAAPVFSMLCWMGAVHTVGFIDGVLMRSVGFPKAQMYYTLFGTLLGLIGFLLSWRHGIYWISVAYVLAIFTQYPVGLWIVCVKCGIRIRGYLASLSASILLSVSIYIAYLSSQHLSGFSRNLTPILILLIAAVCLIKMLIRAARKYQVVSQRFEAIQIK